MTGDGFGGRSWYVAHNYQVGAYTAYTVCGPDKQLYGWGVNQSGELGQNPMITGGSNVPVAVNGMTNVKFYTTGYMNAVIKTDSSAWVWGSFPWQPIASGFSYTPVHILNNVKFADAGINNAVFVKYDGTVWCAGQNTYGALGNGSVSWNPLTTAVKMVGINNAVRAVAAGIRDNSATIVLLADGTVKISGGSGAFNQFQNINDTLSVAIPVAGLNHIVDIKANTLAVFALDSIGDVYTFGRNDVYLGPNAGAQYPVLGLGVPSSDFTPPTRIQFPVGAASIVAISANCDGNSTLALDSNHNVYAWGDNDYGQLGDGTISDLWWPKLVATNVKDIFCGETFCYILKTDNSLWASGRTHHWWAGNSPFPSIWMELPNVERHIFTEIHPLLPPMNLCDPEPYGMICDLSVNLGNDTTLCEGGQIILHSGIDSAAYLWQNGSVNANYTVDTTGTYWVSVKKKYCTYTDTINIIYKPLPVVALGKDTVLCYPDTLALNATNINAVYEWQDHSNDSGYTVSAPGGYFVTVTVNGCKSSDTIQVVYKPLPKVNLGNDTSLCMTKKLVLHAANQNAGYLWQDNSINESFIVTQAGLYWVNVNMNGCKAADSILVNYKNCNCKLTVPNAITPNGDGINDKWIFTNQACYQKTAVHVYNRYGSLVYEKENYQSDWEGMYKSKPLPDGTYYYVINLVAADGKKEILKGNLTILR